MAQTNIAYRNGMQMGDRALRGASRGSVVNLGIERAGELVVMVRDESRESIGRYLDRLDRQSLYAVIVTLAAMVPDDQPLDKLLSWVDALDSDPDQQSLFT